MLKQLLLIGAGGFMGSVARYLVSRLNTRVEWFAIPLGTLTVNVVGSLRLPDRDFGKEPHPDRGMADVPDGGAMRGIHHLFLFHGRKSDAVEKRPGPAPAPVYGIKCLVGIHRSLPGVCFHQTTGIK